MELKLIALLTVSALTISACGGSGGSSSSKTCTLNEVSIDCDLLQNPPTTNNVSKATVSFDSSSETYTATSNGNTYSISRSDFAPGTSYQYDLGAAALHRVGNKYYNFSYASGENSDFAGFGGLETRTGTDGFIGYSGTKTNPTTNSGTATYSGASYVTRSGTNGVSSGDPLVITTDFDQGTLSSASSNSLGLNGQISGNSVSGTSTYGGKTGTFEGGFYSGDELNGIATDDKTYVGVFTTTKTQ